MASGAPPFPEFSEAGAWAVDPGTGTTEADAAAADAASRTVAAAATTNAIGLPKHNLIHLSFT
jgi:hypothetical protein